RGLAVNYGREEAIMDPKKGPSYPDLKGKVPFVTGGSRGIGAVTCRMLAENDVRVAVNGRDAAAIKSVVQDIRDGGGEAIAAPNLTATFLTIHTFGPAMLEGRISRGSVRRKRTDRAGSAA